MTSEMIKRIDREQRSLDKDFWPRTITKICGGLLVSAVSAVAIGIIAAHGINYFLNKQENEILKAFSGNCGYSIAEVGEGRPNAIAREQFEQLRKHNRKRFERVTNDEGVNQLMESYRETKELRIPNYSCN